MKVLANAFLNHKKALIETGDLAPRTWQNYHETAEVLVARFGKGRLVSDLGQDDFAELRKWMAKKREPVRVKNYIQQVRNVFKYGYDSEMLDAPVRFGPGSRGRRRRRSSSHRPEFDALADQFERAEPERRDRSTTTRRSRAPAQRTGRRPHDHGPRDRLLVALGWRRGYPTYEVLGFFFDLHKRNAQLNVLAVPEVLGTLDDFPFDRPTRDRKKPRSAAE